MDGEQVLEKIIVEVFSPLYELVLGVSFIYFLYGVFRYLVELNDPEKKNVNKSHMLYGLIGLFIIFSVGGILKFFNQIFGGLFTL
jgi:hypothetical protein